MDRDWMFRTGGAIIAASHTANLDAEQRKQMSGLAWIQSKHRELMAMPEDQAVKEFDRLDRKVQQSLEGFFGNTPYNPEELSFWGQAGKYIKAPLAGVSDALTSMTELFNRPFRAVSIMDEVGSFSEAWDKAADGRRLFDADKADQIEQFYGPVVSNIAKRIAMGDSFGAVISDLKTDEEFATMEKLLQGDELVTRAMRDYDQARISYGRSLAHLFNLDPNIGAKDQGIEGKVFKGVSGTTDLIAGFVLDPLNLVFLPLASYRKAALGITQINRASLGNPTAMQKFAGTVFGKKFGWDAAFEREGVRQAFDAIGSLVKEAHALDDPLKKGIVRQKIKNIMPSLDDNAINVFIERKVFNADDALDFIREQDSITRIAMGKSGSTEAMLPTFSARNKFRSGIRNAVHNATGYNKNLKELEDVNLNTSFFGDLAQGQSAAEAIQIKGMKNFGSRAAKVFEKAFIERSMYTEGEDKVGRSLVVKSSDSIYTLSRLMFKKADAQALKQLYIEMPESGRRQLVYGLYRTLLDNSGLAKTVEGKRFVDKVLNQWEGRVYSEPTLLSEKTAAAAGLPAGLYNAGDVAGQQLGVAMNHLAHQIILPSLVDINNAVMRQGKLKSLNKMMDFNQAATDMWSALNLLPRLGLRTVLDENLFSVLTMPITLFRSVLPGYKISVTQRMLEDPTGKGVGSVIRHVMKGMTEDLSPEDIARIHTDRTFAAQVFEKKVATGVVGSAYFAGAKGKERLRYAQEIIRNGNMDHIRGFSEGMSAGLATSVPAPGTGVTNLTKEINKDLFKQMKLDGVQLGGEPKLIMRNDAAFNVNARIQLINRIDRNGDIGKIAVSFMENPKIAVENIAKYLRENENVYKQFDRYNSKLTTVESDAFAMYIHVRNLLVNDMDEINKGLLKKIRPTGFGSKFEDISSLKLTADDIAEHSDGFKSEIFGYGKDITAYNRFGDVIEDMVNNGFAMSDRQAATLSREPAVFAYQLHFREQWAASEKAFVKEMMAKNPDMTLESAKLLAADRYTALATDMAINRVLGFVDNPHVRSHLAFSIRNVARYARATEDFYRRAGRVLRENNTRAIIRLRMANEGLSHAGFIHEDENGEKYFTFPVDEIMYNAYAPFLQMFGVETVRPMPLALSGKIKMLTPSLDPESNIPTFAGPLLSASWVMMKNIIPNEYSDTVTRTLFGPYAEGADMYDALMPSTLKRAWTAVKAGSGMEEEQVASATMKSMAFYAANGMAPDSTSSQAERDQYLYDVKATARSIVFLRNLLGVFSPVSPQFSAIQDIPKDVLDAGAVSLKQEFHNLVEAEQLKGNTDAWNTALHKWTKLNPGRLVYTVSESEASTIAPIAKTREAVKWIKSNEEVARKYKSAMVFLMPQAGDFNLDAYSFLKREGYDETKNVDKYFEEITNVQAENQYYDIRKKYEELAANSSSPQQIAQYNKDMEDDLRFIRQSNPYLSRQLEQADGTVQLKKDAVQNLSDALESGLVPETATTRKMREMIFVFNQMYPRISSPSSGTDAEALFKTEQRNKTIQRLLEIAGSDRNANLFYDTILKRLLG